MNSELKSKVGIAVIGRNEGQHLQPCFESLMDLDCTIVYIDSASTDDSLEIAKRFEKIRVRSLEANTLLTAARGQISVLKFFWKKFPV